MRSVRLTDEEERLLLHKVLWDIKVNPEKWDEAFKERDRQDRARVLEWEGVWLWD